MPRIDTRLGKLTGNAWFSSDKIPREFGFAPLRRLGTELPVMVRDYCLGRDREA